MNYPRKVIGYWMSEKKSQKLNWSEFAKVCRDHGFELVKLNLDRPLDDQGPFTVIIHKLTDIIAQAIKDDLKENPGMENEPMLEHQVSVPSTIEEMISTETEVDITHLLMIRLLCIMILLISQFFIMH